MSQSGLPSLVKIEEASEESFECPAGIEKQLKRAAFSKESATEFVKRRTAIDTENERDVVSVYLEDEKMRVVVEDIVGTVNLTPSSRLEIQPKIGWKEILDMYLSVYKTDRSVEHHGVPIDDFLADDINLEDIFIIVALNWYDSLKPIWRNGFLRSFETTRFNSVSARGRIDIEQSLKNLEMGIPKQHYVRKDINYSIPENEIIHKAGQLLLRLFQQGTESSQTTRYFEIFSDVKSAVDELEERGINSQGNRPAEYRPVSTADLPRQRSYYSNAIQISKMILSSTSGKSLAEGSEELTVDYIIDMDSLFENFTQVALEQELADLLDDPLQSTDALIEIEDKPSIRAYTDSGRAEYYPDHTLQVNGETEAVLDSKYYSSDNDPTSFKHSRTNMFAYAFLLETDQMAFLCPSGNPRVRELEERLGEVEVVTPQRTFTIDRYRRQLQSYLQKVLGDHLVENDFMVDLSEYQISHDDQILHDSLQAIHEEHLIVNYPGNFARKVLKEAANQSREIRALRELSKKRSSQIRNDIKRIIEKSRNYDIHVPLFLPAGIARELSPEIIDDEWTGEAIQIYGVQISGERDIESATEIGTFPLDWNNDLDT